MPCGGIYPVKGSHIEGIVPPGDASCWMCGHEGCDHYCEEWDTYLHYACVVPFLTTEEGKVVLKHGHPVFFQQASDSPPDA
jgi:hypothetical protein